ncbi:MAG: DUF2141 domain-containing protein [Flavobacterium sp.]
MIRFLYSVLFLVCAFSVKAQNVNLTVEVSNTKNSNGKVTISLYNSEKTFLKSPLKTITAEIKSNKSTVVFTNLEKGVYAVFAFHDENNNGKMDTNFVGMPKESVVCSNKAKGFMGPPKYEDAKLNLIKDSKIELPFSNKQHQ